MCQFRCILQTNDCRAMPLTRAERAASGSARGRCDGPNRLSDTALEDRITARVSRIFYRVTFPLSPKRDRAEAAGFHTAGSQFFHGRRVLTEYFRNCRAKLAILRIPSVVLIGKPDVLRSFVPFLLFRRSIFPRSSASTWTARQFLFFFSKNKKNPSSYTDRKY